MALHAPTPHIEAKPGDFAPTVLMPGDPLRARFIAENYLEGARLVNNVRAIGGYTGRYKGHPVSVMAHGIGIPSIALYTHELYSAYGVERIIRVGTAGGMQPDVRLRELVLAQGCCTNSSYMQQFSLMGTFAPIASYSLLRCAADICEEKGLRYQVGNVLSSDVFYHADPEFNAGWQAMGVLAVEMEAAALYANAARLGRQALALFTISDHLFTGESTSAQERQSSFTGMMEVALETALRA